VKIPTNDTQIDEQMKQNIRQQMRIDYFHQERDREFRKFTLYGGEYPCEKPSGDPFEKKRKIVKPSTLSVSKSDYILFSRFREYSTCQS
jgi:hypothetical protein